MRNALLALASALTLSACAAGAPSGGAADAAASTAMTDQDKAFYALGLSLGQQISVFGLSATELEQVKRGLTDSVTGAKAEVDLNEFGPKLREIAQERSALTAQKEKDKGKAFQDQAATEANARRTESGLVFVPLTEGTGAQPTASDRVKVHYKGALIDGTPFDSSYERNQPAEFPLRGVVKCWTEGVALMKVGGKAKLVCPSDIAYGDRGRPPKIPGGATLVFEVELLEILAAEQPPAMPELGQ